MVSNVAKKIAPVHGKLTLDWNSKQPKTVSKFWLTVKVSKTYRNIEPHTAKAFEHMQQPDRCPVNIFKTYSQEVIIRKSKGIHLFPDGVL